MKTPRTDGWKLCHLVERQPLIPRTQLKLGKHDVTHPLLHARRGSLDLGKGHSHGLAGNCHQEAVARQEAVVVPVDQAGRGAGDREDLAGDSRRQGPAQVRVAGQEAVEGRIPYSLVACTADTPAEGCRQRRDTVRSWGRPSPDLGLRGTADSMHRPTRSAEIGSGGHGDHPHSRPVSCARPRRSLCLPASVYQPTTCGTTFTHVFSRLLSRATYAPVTFSRASLGPFYP